MGVPEKAYCFSAIPLYVMRMANVIILGEALLLLVFSVFQLLLFFLRNRQDAAFLKPLQRMHAILLAQALIEFILNYALMHFLSIDPTGITTSLVVFQKAPLLYALMVLEVFITPLTIYYLFMTVFRLGGISVTKQRRFAVLTPIVVFMAWSLLGQLTIPLLYSLGAHAQEIHRITRTINFYFFGLLQLVGVTFACSVWFRNRSECRDPEQKKFGDLLIFSIIANMAITCLAGLITGVLSIDTSVSVTSHSTLVAGLAYCSALPYFLVEYAIFRYSVHVFGTQSAAGATQADAADYSIPEGFFDVYRITKREAEIAGFLSQGLSNKEICARLEISHGTVKNHVSNIFGKLGIQSRFEMLGKIVEFKTNPSR